MARPQGTLRTLWAAAVALGGAMVVGCSTPRGVPSGAKLVTEATVKSSFQAPADGLLWIYRIPSRGARGQLHYSGPIGAGEVLVIDPSMNRLSIDGQPLEVVLPGGDVWYQAYFREDRSVRRILEDRPPRDGGRVLDYDSTAPAGDPARRNDGGGRNDGTD
jgi:hypothetical protein